MSLVSTLRSRFKIAFVAEVIAAVSGALLTVLLARLLGPDTYGVLFLAIAILVVADQFGTFGIPRAAARYVSEFKETDPAQVRYVIATALGLTLLLSTGLALVLFLGHDVIGNRIGEPDVSPYLLLGSVYVIVSALTIFVRIILQGFEEIKTASILQATNKSTRLVFAVGLVLLSYGGLGALAGYTLSYAIVGGAGVAYIYVSKYRPLPVAPMQQGLRRRLARYAAPIAVTKSSFLLDQQVDRILVGYFVGPLGVAYYMVGKQVVQFVELPMRALGFTLSPTYGAQKAQGNMETVARLYETALAKGFVVYVPAAAGIILVADPGIPLVFGDDYSDAVPVLQVLALFAVVLSVTRLTGEGLDYLGRARERAITRGVSALLNVGLNLLLIPRFGAVGAAVTTVATFSLYAAVTLYVMSRELYLRTGWLLKQFGYAALVTVVMAGGVWPASRYVTGPLTLVLTIGLGVTIWGALVVAFDLLDISRLDE
jgi:O-antigen/teichoic acid export membrane protein